MNRESLQELFVIRESVPGSASIGYVPTKQKQRDPIAERVRARAMKLMEANDLTDQKALTARCRSPFVRQDQIHKFVKGDLQFPPLSFLDTVLRTIGSNLVEALDQEPPVRQLPILREDVREVAVLLEARSLEYVASLKTQLQEIARAKSRGRTGGPQRGGR